MIERTIKFPGECDVQCKGDGKEIILTLYHQGKREPNLNHRIRQVEVDNLKSFHPASDLLMEEATELWQEFRSRLLGN